MSAYVSPIGPGGVDQVPDPTTLAPGHYGKPLILDRIFQLLVQMISVLQKTAATQAERLNFLSEWQKAFTDQLNQIHSFVQGNGDAISFDSNPDSDAAHVRQDLNTVNTTYTQQIQGSRQTVSDDAKALQSNVNQTNDAVNNQSDMATSILQQLSTILTSIYSSA